MRQPPPCLWEHPQEGAVSEETGPAVGQPAGAREGSNLALLAPCSLSGVLTNQGWAAPGISWQALTSILHPGSGKQRLLSHFTELSPSFPLLRNQALGLPACTEQPSTVLLATRRACLQRGPGKHEGSSPGTREPRPISLVVASRQPRC